MTALPFCLLFALAAAPVEAPADEFATIVQEIHEIVKEKSIVKPSPYTAERGRTHPVR